MRIKTKAVSLIAVLSVVLSVLLIAGSQAYAMPVSNSAEATTATWPTIEITQIATDLVNPVLVTNANDGSGRIFIVEQNGRIRIYTNSLVGQPFLDIRDRVLYSGEQGLLSAAFPPDYASKGYFYVYYTNKNGDNVVSRFHLGASPNQANPDSEEIILPLAHPNQSNHNGGQLAFGPDGYLYIGTGDGGGGGDPYNNAQNPASLLGKILRIDVEKSPQPPVLDNYMIFLPIIPDDYSGGSDPVLPYMIPPDNPFVGQAGYRQEIWALGLRNPWRFGFDRQTNDLYIGDVGQSSREEIDFQPAGSAGGQNYGWDCREGDLAYQPANCGPSVVLTEPVYTYATHVDQTCAVTGGYVYRGIDYPGMRGIYFFGDYCQGAIRGLQQETGSWANLSLLSTGFYILGFGEDEQGELYMAVTNGTTGSVYRIISANP